MITTITNGNTAWFLSASELGANSRPPPVDLLPTRIGEFSLACSATKLRNWLHLAAQDLGRSTVGAYGRACGYFPDPCSHTSTHCTTISRLISMVLSGEETLKKRCRAKRLQRHARMQPAGVTIALSLKTFNNLILSKLMYTSILITFR